MARTEGQWQKGISLITPSENVPVLLRNTYLNFGGETIGETGYGFRDNAGVMQYKDASGSWSNFGAGGSSSTFLNLTDTPAAYTGQAGKVVAVKSDATGLEFVYQGVSEDLIIAYATAL